MKRGTNESTENGQEFKDVGKMCSISRGFFNIWKESLV